MTLEIIKGQKVSLMDGNLPLSQITFGIGWEIDKKYVSNENDEPYELDSAAFLLDINGKVADSSNLIYYNQNKKSGVEHHLYLENLSGDQEYISVNTSLLPPQVERIVLTLSLFNAQMRKQCFKHFKSVYIRLINSITGKELGRLTLRTFDTETSIVLGELYRYRGNMRFNAVGFGFKGGIETLCQSYGAELPNSLAAIYGPLEEQENQI